MFELSLICPEHGVEALSEALEALEALSVCVEDADVNTAQEQALFGEPGLPVAEQAWQNSKVLALFETEEQAQIAQKLLQELLSQQDFWAQVRVLSLTPVPEQDWVRLTQSQFEPVAITPDFWIVPSWHSTPAQARQVIQLDPGLAFGTGTHPTTRMCLRWIAQHPATGQRVLDYGCGSGILAIAAARFGATDIDAVDIDPTAVQTSQDNARVNGVNVRCGLPETAHGPYQWVLANILAVPLKVLAPLLCAHLAPQGQLVLAGVLKRQTEELIEAYRPYIQLHASDHEDDWVLLTGRLAAPSPSPSA